VIIAKIGDWSIHGSGIVPSDELDAIHDIRLLHDRLVEENLQTRKRLAKSLQKAKQSARRKGYERGRNEGLQEIVSAFTQHMKVWGSVEKRLKLSVAKVVGDALGNFPPDALLIARIQKGILAARQNPVLRIHVHPSMFALVDGMVAKFDEQNGRSGCEVVSDTRLLESECRIETETGLIEVDFNRQVRALCDALLYELRIGLEQDGVLA
jgi:flagellar biosynthesis/type III secretory pathway protein FliH